MKKKLQIIYVVLATLNSILITHNSLSQNVGINSDGANGDSNTMLDIKATDNTSSTFGLKVKDAAGDAKMVVRSDGRVGIGITNPTQKLHIWSGNLGIGTTTFMTQNWFEFGLNDGATGTGIDFHGGTTLTDWTSRIHRLPGDNGEFQIANAGTGLMNFYANGATPRMTITSNGDIGMGTTTPTDGLNVINGAVNIAMGNLSQGITINRSTSGFGPKIALTGGREYGLRSSRAVGGAPEGDAMAFIDYTANSTRMVINSSGNVGIGTSTPSSPANVSTFLEINGTAHAGFVLRDATDYYECWQDAGGVLWHNGASTLFLAKNNNVGINTNAPTAVLDVFSGSSNGTYTASGWIHTSDSTLKTNVKPIGNPLDKIEALNGVYFNWTTTPDSNRQIGFIAQEVERILPELVVKDENGKYGMTYGGMSAVLVNAIKEQQQIIENQKEQIEVLTADNKEIIQRLNFLEKHLETSNK